MSSRITWTQIQRSSNQQQLSLGKTYKQPKSASCTSQSHVKVHEKRIITTQHIEQEKHFSYNLQRTYHLFTFRMYKHTRMDERWWWWKRVNWAVKFLHEFLGDMNCKASWHLPLYFHLQDTWKSKSKRIPNSISSTTRVDGIFTDKGHYL